MYLTNRLKTANMVSFTDGFKSCLFFYCNFVLVCFDRNFDCFDLSFCVYYCALILFFSSVFIFNFHLCFYFLPSFLFSVVFYQFKQRAVPDCCSAQHVSYREFSISSDNARKLFHLLNCHFHLLYTYRIHYTPDFST